MKFLDIINARPFLKSPLKYVMLHSKSNHAGYHNFFHVQTLFEQCYEALRYETVHASRDNVVLTAVLFHDFNHSMGEKNDAENIKRAIAGFKKWNTKYNGGNKEFFAEVVEVIKATQYPYAIDAKDLSIEQAIIRDADLTQILQPTWIAMNVLGLAKELKKPIGAVIGGNMEFFRNIHPQTKWFKMKWGAKQAEVFAELEKLKEIYGKGI